MKSENQQRHLSTHSLVCPVCGNGDLRIMGTKKSSAGEIGAVMAFGAIANLTADMNSKNDYSQTPVWYKCKACRKKFASSPIEAAPEEILEKPCSVSFTRLSSFIGMAVSQQVWLNGVKVASVRNGKTVTFETSVRHNTIFVTDQYGVAFPGDYKFEAESGGSVEVRFKRKFR